MPWYCFLIFFFFCQSSRYISWRRKWQPTPVFLSGESHGQRSLSGYSTGRCKIVGHDLATNTHTRCISNGQLCLKTTGLYEDLLLLSSLFYSFYFIFSAPISFSLCFPISPSLLFFFLMFFLKPLSSIVEKLLYTYIYIIYIL